MNDRCHSSNRDDVSQEWGDFNTPEQTVGAYAIDYPWESCISMGGGNWSWMGRDHAVLSYRTCLRMLISCAGGGGNLWDDLGEEASDDGMGHNQLPDLRELLLRIRQRIRFELEVKR